MSDSRIMIVTTVPPEHLEEVLEAIAKGGGGVVRNYTHCAFMNPGTGRFKPGAGASPHIGEREAINQVAEVRIETFCEQSRAKVVVNAIREAHPYEEVVLYILPLLSENDL